MSEVEMVDDNIISVVSDIEWISEVLRVVDGTAVVSDSEWMSVVVVGIAVVSVTGKVALEDVIEWISIYK